MTDEAPCYIPVEDGPSGNMYSVAELLGAAGTSLDDSYDLGGGLNDTVRHAGIILNLQIIYMNSYPWYGRLSKIVYVYDLGAVPILQERVAYRLDFAGSNRSVSVT